MLKKLKQSDIASIHKIPKQKISNYLSVPSNQPKSKHKSITNKLSSQTIKPILQSKTSLQQRLKNTDQLLKTKSTQRILTKSTQQNDKQQKNLFKNTQIKKSIQLHKNQLEKIREKTRRDAKSLTSDQKQQKNAYYGNTTTSNTKSGKKSSSSKFSSKDKSKKSSSKTISMQQQKNNHLKKHQQTWKVDSSYGHNNMRSPQINSSKKQILTKRKQQKRLKKIQSQYLKMLQEKLELKQSQYNTIKTRNLLQEAKGLGGWVDGLNQEEAKRLKRIHRTEEQILDAQITQIKRQILGICENQKNQIFNYGGNYYGCEDVMSWIQGKD